MIYATMDTETNPSNHQPEEKMNINNELSDLKGQIQVLTSQLNHQNSSNNSNNYNRNNYYNNYNTGITSYFK